MNIYRHRNRNGISSLKKTSARELITSKSGWGDGVIADYDDDDIAQALADVDVPIIGVGGSYHLAAHYPSVHYIATDNYALVESAFLHLKEKGINRFAFYGLPASSGKRWAAEREYAFCQLVAQEKYRGVVYQGLETAPGKLAARAKTGWRTGCKPCRRKPGLSPLPTPGQDMCCKFASICISRFPKNCASSVLITKN
ncbi:xylose operon regulatory protein [Citrobacter koseri]|uniref:Xylose operon regulatory protein n=1 Tax=Citrobacter koseri TaxID=545 RepID=A0A447UMI9_CITKO|nr:xylose operon regulatory protein [Citrobacter koseri]